MSNLTRRSHSLFPSLFDEMLGGIPDYRDWFGTGQSFVLKPAVDIQNTPERIVLTMELPGVDPDNVKIELNAGVLYISGEKHRSTKEEKPFREERYYGKFSRSFIMPENVDVDKLTAAYEKGVLALTIPKTVVDKPKPKRIPIKVQ